MNIFAFSSTAIAIALLASCQKQAPAKVKTKPAPKAQEVEKKPLVSSIKRSSKVKKNTEQYSLPASKMQKSSKKVSVSPPVKENFGLAPSRKKKPKFPIDPLELETVDRLSPVGNSTLERCINVAIQYQQFDQLRSKIQADLYTPLKDQDDIDQLVLDLTKNKGWAHAVNVYAALGKISIPELSKKLTSDPKAREFYSWLFTNPKATQQFITNLSEHDNSSAALDIWQQIYFNETEEFREKYLNLAIATILVHDSARSIGQDRYEKDDVKALRRYELFRQNAEKGRLKTRPSKMPVSDLIWVIDVPITDDEIEWAIKKANFRRKKWGKSYAHIDYLMERAVNDENPYSSYTFQQIEKHGGICGDQTYFSVNTAKANGIPATGITGSGDRGGHAWMAYKPKEDEWDTSTGRYENYTNGSCIHPQTNQQFTEFDLLLLQGRKMEAKDIEKSLLILRSIKALESHQLAQATVEKLLQKAIATAPLLEDPWLDYVAFLEQASDPKTSSNQWKKVVSKIERTFRDHPTMWLTARDITLNHILTDADEKTLAKSQARFRDELARKFPKRGDLIRTVISDQEELRSEAADFKTVRSFYKDAFRSFGKDTQNFKFLARRYFEASEDFPDDQKQVVNDIKKVFDRSIDKKSSDFFKAKTEIEILGTISRYYQTIGETKKAEKLEKEAEKRLKKSSRKAL